MEKESIMSTNNRSRLLDFSIKLFSILATIVGILLAVFYINTPESNLEMKILANTSLIDIKEDFPKLNIVYDSIDFINDKKNISITILEIVNTGNKSISTNDYDLKLPFGFKLINANLIKTPELVSSSDSEYFKDIIKNNKENSIILNYKIIDPKEYVQLKFYSIHNNEVKPKIESLGKISGQKKIKIIDNSEVDLLKDKKAIQMHRFTQGLSSALIIILSLLTLSLYKKTVLKVRDISYLKEKNNELKNKIEKMKIMKK